MTRDGEALYERGDGVRLCGTTSEGTVRRVQQLPAGIFYIVDFGGGRVESVPENDLETATPTPLESLLARRFEDAAEFSLRVQALRLTYAYAHDGAVCLSNSRLEPYPHQIYVAHRALQHLNPRVLLADEVGLGKTVEAGLILKELRARGLVKRALIITPANLVDQWCWELRNKFNEVFVPYTRSRLDDLRSREPDGNPWLSDPNIICSRQLVARRTTQAATGSRAARQRTLDEEAIAEVDWDIIIVDEAHHFRRTLNGQEQRTTLAYQLAERLRTQALLLLTATPMQLDDYELYSLLELLDASLFPTYREFQAYNARTGKALNEAVGGLQRWVDLDAAERDAIAARTQELLMGRAGLAPAQEEQDVQEMCRHLESPLGREDYIHRLTDMHRLSGVMMRNRKRVIGGFADRAATIIEIEMSPAEEDLYHRVSAYVQQQYNLAREEENRALGFVMATFQRLLASSSYALARALERRRDRLSAALNSPEGGASAAPAFDEDEADEWETDDLPDELAGLVSYRGQQWRQDMVAEIDVLSSLVRLAGTIERDTKLQHLCAHIRQLFHEEPETKILIFTAYRDTLDYIRRALGESWMVAIFHGGLDQRAKDEQVELFRGRAPIMISTEAGGEGRNFQFCHILFNYDLPWNPMKVEQRIGRIDRIGQRHQVRIFNFAAPDTIEGKILTRLHRRIRLFEDAVGGLDPILDGRIKRCIEELSLAGGAQSDEQIDRIADQIALDVARVRDSEERLRDFVMDLNSLRRDEADRLLQRTPTVTNADLQRFVMAALARFPTVTPPRSLGAEIWRICVPNALLGPIRHPVYEPATFDPRTAVRNESADFIAFGHPLVSALLSHCTDPAAGSRAALRYVDDTELAGFEGLQVVYTVRYGGIRQIERLHCVVVDRALHSDEDLAQRIMLAPDATPPSDNHTRPVITRQGGDGVPRARRIPGIWELGHSTAETSTAAERSQGDGPPEGTVALRDDPALIARCYEAAEIALSERITVEWQSMVEQNEATLEQEVNKLERIRGYRRWRAESILREARDTLRRHEMSDDPDVQRILSADRGRVEAAQQALTQLNQELDVKRAALEKKRTVTRSIVVEGVALVYGPPAH